MQLAIYTNLSAACRWNPWRAFSEQLRRAALLLTLLFLVLEGAAAEEGAGSEPPYGSEELARQAADWDVFNSGIQQELRLLVDKGLIDKEAFNPAPSTSSKWWDEQGTKGKALRARIVRKLRANPLMEGASNLSLWFMVGLLEQGARVRATVKDLKVKSPNNAPFASGFGPGSERERFGLWTECRPLWPELFLNSKDDNFEVSIRAAVESRLRGARLYGGLTRSSTGEDFVPSGEPLQVVVNLGSGLFSVSVGLQKRLFDPITGLRSFAYADYGGGGYSSFGAGPPEFVHSVLSDHLDRFIADYLRVNADACGGPSEVAK